MAEAASTIIYHFLEKGLWGGTHMTSTLRECKMKMMFYSLLERGVGLKLDV